MRMPLRPFGALLVGACCAAACGSKTNPGGSCPVAPAPVTFAMVQSQVLTSCTSCHAKDAKNRFGAPPSVNFDTLQDAKDHADAANMDIIGGRMPPTTPLSDDLACVYDAWIKNDYAP